MSARYVENETAMIVRHKKTEVVEKALSRMVEKSGGITARGLVGEARNPGHELHEYFEWDDSIAAEKYRLRQATEMILATRFVCFLVEKDLADKTRKLIDEAGGSSPHPHRVRKLLPDFGEKGVFKDRVEILSNEETRRAIVERKISVLRSWCESVVDVDELSHIRTNILALVNG